MEGRGIREEEVGEDWESLKKTLWGFVMKELKKNKNC